MDTSCVCPVVVCIPADECTHYFALYLTVVQFLVCICVCVYGELFSPVELRANASYGLLILEVSRSHTTTHHSRYDSSVRVNSSSQRPLYDNIQHWQQTNMHDPGGIRTHIPSKQAVSDLHLRAPCRWDRVWWITEIKFDDVSLMPSLFVIHTLWVRRTETF